jgi:energy-coupling factor transporter ATP-binding protein EcfA2
MAEATSHFVGDKHDSPIYSIYLLDGLTPSTAIKRKLCYKDYYDEIIITMNVESIILIGPEGSGKSTIGKIVANSLAKELYSLDRHRDELYAPFNYDKAFAEKIYEEQGLWAFYQHWKAFEYQAVSHILENASKGGDEFYGKILDFGAGHSVFEDPEELAKVGALMEPYRNVILVMPCEDVEEAVKITEARRGHELGLNKHFMEHPSNKRLAKYIIYTKDTTVEECAERVLQIIRQNDE